MKKHSFCLFYLLLLSCFLVTTVLSQSVPDTLRLFHIGNSFSGNATRYLPQLAKDGGHYVIIGRAELGSCSFQRHWSMVEAFESNPEDPLGKQYKGKSLKMLLTEEPWDVISIQQNSMNSSDYGSYMPYAGTLYEYVKAICPKARIVIMQTWAYRSDAKTYGRVAENTFAQSQKEMWQASRSAYLQLSKELNIPIVPIGDAFWSVDSDKKWGYKIDKSFDWDHPQQPDLPDQTHSLHGGYHWDKEGKLSLDANHADEAGCYLAGLVWDAFLFKDPVSKLSFVPEEVSPEFSGYLKKIAKSTVKKNSKTK